VSFTSCLTLQTHTLHFSGCIQLQRIKTEDESGNVLEEPRETPDPDSPALVRGRIQRLLAAGGLPVLVKLLAHGSAQTKEAAARAIRQVCSEEKAGARGLMAQQGGLRACCQAATCDLTDTSSKAVRTECAHAVAKTLVTTNPALLSEHLRLGAITALVALARDVDASTLQQFEALLALTNLASAGLAEQNRIASERGTSAVHYLIFSDHTMVRRAATETLCNMATHESVLKVQ
jgi:hypothetical protein